MPDRDLVSRDRSSKTASPPSGTNYLLAIAINEYQYCSKLNNAVRDVEAFIELMISRYHFDQQHVTFIKDAEATKRRIEQEFFRLIKTITPQDNLIIYFSGHGRHDEHFGGNWVPVEAGTSDDDWPDYLANDTIKSYLSKIKSFHTFLIADSCFSGSLFIDKSKEKFSGDRRDTEPSRWGLTSGKKEIVSDGRPGHHSPFATALLDVLRRADQPPGVMRICDLVLEKVAANAEQTPMGSPLLVPGHQGGQMVLYFRDDEETAWQAALTTNSIPAYTDFYDRYPQSQYRRQALDKIEELEEQDAWRKVPKNRLAALLRYMEDNPYSPHYQEAQQLATALRMSAGMPPSTETDSEERQSIVPPLIITPKFKVPEHMALVKGGTFYMEEGQQVILSNFMIAKHQLSFEEYDAFCKATNRELPDDWGWSRGKHPVINVSWYDAVAYCNWRSQLEGFELVYQIDKKQIIPNWQARGYRLPTDAEWEYAARGGQLSRGLMYAGSNEPDTVAWYSDNSAGQTHPVGQKQANELGLYDMSGNVWEWCWDRFGAYTSKTSIDPKGPNKGSYRIQRGGSWYDNSTNVRITRSFDVLPAQLSNRVGFRLARTTVA